MLPSVAEREAFIRQEAARLGIDPEVALRVARREGLAPNTWQSNVQQPYGREQSFGDFQLHLAPKGYKPGLGNDFMAKTGLDPRDPANWQAMNKFALEAASRGGWGPWMGAKAAGVIGMMGIGGKPAAAAPKAMGTSMGGYASGPAAVQARMDTGQQMGLLDDEPTGSVDLEALKAFGQQMQDASAPAQEQFEWLQPQVLKPLRQFTLGKGLLG